MNKRIRKKKKNKEILNVATDIAEMLKSMPAGCGVYIEHGYIITLERAVSHACLNGELDLTVDISGTMLQFKKWPY